MKTIVEINCDDKTRLESLRITLKCMFGIHYTIRELPGKGEPVFTIQQINDWLETFSSDNEAFVKLTHPGVGIEAFTEKKNKINNGIAIAVPAKTAALMADVDDRSLYEKYN